MGTRQEQEAPAEVQIPILIGDILKAKKKLKDIKTTLKDFPIKSDKLTKLKTTKKDLNEQCKEEVEKIEQEYFGDKEFEKAHNAELTTKNQIKEKTALLKAAVKAKHKIKDFSSEDHVVEGEQLRFQFEFAPRLYINGEELK